MFVLTTAPAWRGVLYVATAAVAWGTGGVVAAILYRDAGLGPIAVSWWRFAIGLAALAVARRMSRRGDPAPVQVRDQRGWFILAVIGFGLALYMTAYFAAVAFAGVAIATVVTLGAGPLLIAAGSRLFMAERFGVGASTALAAAIGGLGLLVFGGGRPAGAAPAAVVGVGWALLSAIGYAGVTLLQRAAGGGDDPYDTALVGFGVGGACLLPFAIHEGLVPTGDLPQAALLLAYLGLVPTAAAYCLFFASLRSIRATTASLVALLEPVTATAIAVVLLGEELSAATAAGAAVLLVAVGIHVCGSR